MVVWLYGSLGSDELQLRQMTSGIITWVCTNSPIALDAPVTAKAVCACLIG